ncbi:MAG: hypothetical protein HZA36_00195 [Parcubacteria group bacterium]|nr:hypothetical protein [Parcubacteria group bacterium]
MVQHNWKELLRIAYIIAKQSHDPSTQNGALIINDNGSILGDACNQFPRGVKETPERWERPLKYKIIEHAERNVIFHCARLGIPTSGLTMVCPWAACADCARAIIQAGINRLVIHKQAGDRSPEFWQKEIDVAFEMFREAGVEIVTYDGKVGVKYVLHSGQLWNP